MLAQIYGSIVPESVVTIVVNGRDASAVHDTLRANASLQAAGEMGLTSGRVFVSAAAVDKPENGATIKVNGERVTVSDVKDDPAGAMYVISYFEQKPVTISQGV